MLSSAPGYGNPPGCHTGAYQDHYDYDNRLWAAAELYRATGEQRFATFVEKWYNGEGPRKLSSNSGAGTSRLAHAMEAYTEAAGDGRKVDATIAREHENAFFRRAKFVLRLVQAQPFSTGDRIDVPGWIGWGKFTYGSRVVITLLKAWKKTGKQEYLDAAHLAIGPQYGANPLSMSFVTGLGERYPRNPTCEVCLADDEPEPYPGLPIFGVFAHLANGHPFYKIANHDANNFPYIMYTSEDRPVLTRYIDHKQIIPQSEYTISTMSHTLIAVGLLAKRRNRLIVRNATLQLSDGSTSNSLVLELELPYTLPTASCRWVFDDASVATFGVGSNCTSSGEAIDGGNSTLKLRVWLGSGASVTAGTILKTRGPEVGYVNYETKQWQQTLVVRLPGGSRRARRLMPEGDFSNRLVAWQNGATTLEMPFTHRRMQSTGPASPSTDDAAKSFGLVVGTEQEFESGVMLTTNSSAPEPIVSPYGAVGFDALAQGEAQSSVGMQVDFTRRVAPDGGLFACPNDCSGRGTCLADVGECLCLIGSSGDACEVGLTAGPPPSPPPLPRHPPFTPLRQGESIVTVTASVVTLGFTIAGGVEAFDTAARTSLKTNLQASLRCYEPACFLELRVSPGSVQVDAILTIPDSVSGSAAATADITAAATALASTDSSALSSTLGVSVTAITAPTVQQGVSVPLVVAPPPPNPLPSKPLPLPPLAPPLSPNAPARGDGVAVIITTAVAVVGSMLITVIIAWLRRRRRLAERKQVLMSPSAAPVRSSTRV